MKFIVSREDQTAMCRQAPEFIEPVKQIDLPGFECCADLFYALVQNVVAQQLATKAADTIFARLLALLEEKITAEKLLDADFAALRACGLSGRKIEYLRGIAQAVLAGTIDFQQLRQRSDAEIIADLVQLKGVGVWTAEMLLIFALGRKDILSYKDLGIRRGIMLLNRLDSLPEEKFAFYRQRYSPYGTLASLYLWRLTGCNDGVLAVGPVLVP